MRLSDPRDVTDDKEQYRALDVVRVPLGTSEELVYCSPAAEAEVLELHDSMKLRACKKFATLKEHSMSISKAFSTSKNYVPVEDVQSELKSFASKGLLTSKKQLLDMLHERPENIRVHCESNDDLKVDIKVDVGSRASRTSASAATSPAVPASSTISTFAIPTRNRPDSLKRCINSFSQCAIEEGRTMRIVISDGSDQETIKQQNIDVLRQLKTSGYAGELVHIDETQRETFASEIAAASGIDPAITKLALTGDNRFPVTTGANRNTLLLACVDELSVQVDDDTICETAKNPAFAAQLKLTSSFDYMRYWYYDENEWQSQQQGFEPPNFFRNHEMLLGKTVSECMKQFDADQIDLNDLESTFLKRLRTDNRVVVTSLGVAGDSGGGGAFPLLRQDAEARGRLVRNKQVYEYTLATHQIIRSAPSPMISDTRACSGLNLGLDGRGYLPPFTPTQRNQDGVFGALFYAGMAGFTAHLPWVLVHRRDQHRKVVSGEKAGSASGEIIEMLITPFQPIISAGAADNIAAVGHLLVELGSADQREFENLVSDMLHAYTIYKINALETLLTKYGNYPDYWAADVRAHCNTLREFIASDEVGTAADLVRIFGPEQARTELRLMVRNFGEILKAWPAMRNAARELRRKERVIGTIVS